MRDREVKLIVTADDLGIDEHINSGIIETFYSGSITSASLLMNAPATEQGIQLALEHPELEIGLHLSIVEGVSLRGKISTVTDKQRYFNNQICLLRDWKMFFKYYFLQRIDYKELREELELQFIAFSNVFQSIPFVNGTQHLHLLPRVFDIVWELSIKYCVHAIRLPSFTSPSKLWLNPRMPFQFGFELLGSMARHKIRKSNIKSPDFVYGMQYSGRLNMDKIALLFDHMGSGTHELVIHPGFKSEKLIASLPNSYSNFQWDMERQALNSELFADHIKQKKINLIRFADL